jgi:ABC-type Fe3+ transport system substrate-binding protein
MVASQPAWSQGWKKKWDRTVAAAKKEGKVVVWGPGGSLIRKAATREFEKDFPGIKVEFTGGRGTSAATKLRAERDSGLYSADVFINGVTTANFRLKPYGALDPIGPALILPEVTNPKNWAGNRLEYADTERKYTLVFFTQVSPQLVYDSNRVKPEEIDTLAKLLNPKWKNKLTINDPRVAGAGVPWFRRVWVEMGPKKATAYFKALRAQAGALTRNTRRQVEWIAQGKYSILVAPSSSAFRQLKKRGVKFGVLAQFKDIQSHIGTSTGNVTLVNKAPHPNAARVYINWLLSKRGQEVWQGVFSIPSRRVDISKAKLPARSIPKPGVKYWPSHTEKNQTRSAEETKIIKKLFGR